ncbi:hypothetical protein CBL_07522 [Carabus blaptoides fortunei]
MGKRETGKEDDVVASSGVYVKHGLGVFNLASSQLLINVNTDCATVAKVETSYKPRGSNLKKQRRRRRQHRRRTVTPTCDPPDWGQTAAEPTNPRYTYHTGPGGAFDQERCCYNTRCQGPGKEHIKGGPLSALTWPMMRPECSKTLDATHFTSVLHISLFRIFDCF